ncbi:aldo/keto reductase [Micrococcus luteus]|uniref:aldo/keto reductase n=1 Tax=Micrococcus luteus TaxID=1270 RepID=UPI00352D0687
MSTAPTHPPLDLDPTPATPIVLGTMAWGSVPPPPPDADPGAGPEGPAGAAQAEAAVERARRALRAGIEAGVDLLDTADIYGAGRSEETVGRLLHELPYEERSALKVQTKCGIVLHEPDPAGRRLTRYDSSPEHVRAFLDAREAGLVGKLGVSNLGVGRVLEFQRELESQAADGTGLACVQVELGLHHRTLVEAVVLANHPDAPADADAGRLGPVCAAEGIELQAWGPLGQGRFSSGDDGAAGVVGEVAAELGVSREAVVLAWLLRLPWCVRPVIGTQDPERVAACTEAAAAAEAMDSAQWHRLVDRGARRRSALSDPRT